MIGFSIAADTQGITCRRCQKMRERYTIVYISPTYFKRGYPTWALTHLYNVRSWGRVDILLSPLCYAGDGPMPQLITKSRLLQSVEAHLGREKRLMFETLQTLEDL